MAAPTNAHFVMGLLYLKDDKLEFNFQIKAPTTTKQSI